MNINVDSLLQSKQKGSLGS